MRWFLALALSCAGAGVFSQDVPVVTVQASEAVPQVQWEAVVQAVRQVTVSAQTQGRIQTMSVKAGDRVRMGTLLAVVDNKEVHSEVQRNQAQLAQAQAQWQEASTRLNRTQSLQAQGFVSAAALDSAQAQLQGATAAREQAQAGVRQAQVQQGYARIVAPYEGWVLQTHAQSGDLAVVGAPLVTLYAPQPLRVVVQVPTSRAALALGAQRYTLVLGEGERSVRPVGVQWVPSADPVAQTQEWRLELAGADSADLVPGQQVQMRTQHASAKTESSRLYVPASAIVRRGELTAVYVKTAQGFVLRAVRAAGMEGDDRVGIVSGLRAGDVVATDPIKAATKR